MDNRPTSLSPLGPGATGNFKPKVRYTFRGVQIPCGAWDQGVRSAHVQNIEPSSNFYCATFKRKAIGPPL